MGGFGTSDAEPSNSATTVLAAWNYTVKSKVVPVLNKVPRHDDIWRSGNTTPCILNLSTSWT